MQAIDQIFSCQRAHGRLSIHWISELYLLEAFDQLSFEVLVMVLVDNESFGREANLTSIVASPSQSFRHCFVQISVFENHKRIVSTQLKDTFLQVLSSFFRDKRTSPSGTSEADSLKRWVLKYLFKLIVRSEDILVFSIVEASFFHRFFDQNPQIWARVSVSDHKSVANKQTRQPSFHVKVEREVERDDVIDDSNGEVLDEGMSSSLGLHELRNQGFIVFAVVVAKVDGFLDFFFSVHNWLPHLECDGFRELLDPGSHLFSNSFDDFCPILEGSFSLDFKGSVRPIELGLQLIFGEEVVGVFELTSERIL